MCKADTHPAVTKTVQHATFNYRIEPLLKKDFKYYLNDEK